MKRLLEKIEDLWAQPISKVIVALIAVWTLGGIGIYFLEGGLQNGFESLTNSLWWTIVTMTTVGYGDIAPQTPLGQFFASIIMILGYSIIAVPTGMISVELSKTSLNTQYCSACSFDNHEDDAIFCKKSLICQKSFEYVQENLWFGRRQWPVGQHSRLSQHLLAQYHQQQQ